MKKGGAIHDLGLMKVRWVFDDKFLMYYKNGKQIWTTTFETIRIELKRLNKVELKRDRQLKLF